MSRQNKARQKALIAKQFSELRKNGGKGPARTTPKHGKVKTLRYLAEQKRLADIEKAAAQADRTTSREATKQDRSAKPANGRRKPTNAPRAGK